MNLPNYFLADLPPDALLTPALIAEACQTIQRNRDQYLATRSTHDLIAIIAQLARQWREPSFPLRQRLLEASPRQTGFAPATLAAGLDAFFEEITEENLHLLIQQDLGHRQRLENFSSSEPEFKSGRAAIARGPRLMAHVAAGNIPNSVLFSIILGLLVRSAQFVKCASGFALAPRLFAHSIYEMEPKLGACLEIAEWRGGNEPLEAALFGEAELVTATGSDEAIEAIRRRVPPRVRLVRYGHRVSFGFISKESLRLAHLPGLAARAAVDVAAWNQLGCLSPHLFYVEHGGQATAEQFAEVLADELARREQSDPRGAVSVEVSAVIASRRAAHAMRGAHSPDTRVWSSEGSTAWTVVYEADPEFRLSCLHRFIYVKAVASLSEALRAAEILRGRISTVGIAAPEHAAGNVALELARRGVPRICPIGRMQRPPLAWRHDGRPALGDLVTWVDWEQNE